MKYLLATTALALLAAAPLHAQTLSGQTASAAQAIAIAGGTGGGSGAGTQTQRLVTVPTVIPAPIQGANPCNVGAAAGGGLMGGGITLSIGIDGKTCRDQEWFRFLNMAGLSDVAIAYVCQEYSDLRSAFATAGRPCPQDRQQAAAAQPALVTQPVAYTPPAPPAARARPDWCGTASPAERRGRQECN